MVCAYIACNVRMLHLLRVSNWEAALVDRLSRRSTTTVRDKKLLESFQLNDLPKCIVDWIQNPIEDWNLADRMLSHVKKRVPKPGL